ncbi:hypothetical protein H7K13_01325 [Priestia aryabhattai]|uniref:hypothetical protein n=1 Tax=Priestia aryabhattai TaxID=412384 RepID=UPI0013F676DC|nr:hypothetical protein [Priestia aryabhattai]MBY0073560.1 hypothetical protein [Priestia aryabhattai]NHH92686.1 hypothetical protein [Bacillus sp. MB95]
MKKYKLATVLLSTSLALSACGSDSEKEESKNDSEETTSAAPSAAVHKKDTSGESKETKTTGNLPDKEQQALDGALLMFTHAKNKNFNAFKNDMELRSKFSLDMYQSEPADSEYKEIMVNWATLNYANFNLKVIDWDKLSDATQIEIGEDYGGDSVLVSVTTKDDTLTQEEKEGMDIVLIMNKYNNRYMMKEFKAADIIQDDINEQMYAGNSITEKNAESEEGNNNNDNKEQNQKLTSEQQQAIDVVKKSLKDAEDGNLTAFTEDMSHYTELPSSEIQEGINMFGAVGYLKNDYSFRIIDFEDFPDDSEVRDNLLNQYGNQFIPISVTNNKDTVPEEVLVEEDEKIFQKVSADLLVLVQDYEGEYKIRALIPLAMEDSDIADVMYAHDPKTLRELKEAIAKQ